MSAEHSAAALWQMGALMSPNNPLKPSQKCGVAIQLTQSVQFNGNISMRAQFQITNLWSSSHNHENSFLCPVSIGLAKKTQQLLSVRQDEGLSGLGDKYR